MRDDEQALVARVAAEEREQVARRAVRPVQVLDDEQDRRRLAEPAEQPEHALEDADLEPLGLARRERVRRPSTPDSSGTSRASSGRLGPAAAAMRVGIDLAGQGAERLDDRTERQAVVAERDRAALEDEPVRLREAWRPTSATRRLLPTPASPPTSASRGLAGRGNVGRREERCQLPRSTDEDRAG